MALLTVAAGVMSAAIPVVPVGAIVPGGVSAFACRLALTLLVWAAIEDGKRVDAASA